MMVEASIPHEVTFHAILQDFVIKDPEKAAAAAQMVNGILDDLRPQYFTNANPYIVRIKPVATELIDNLQVLNDPALPKIATAIMSTSEDTDTLIAQLSLDEIIYLVDKTAHEDISLIDWHVQNQLYNGTWRPNVDTIEHYNEELRRYQDFLWKLRNLQLQRLKAQADSLL